MLLMFGNKFADEPSDFAGSAGIKIITQGNKLITLHTVDANQQLTVLFPRFFAFITHESPFSGAFLPECRRLPAWHCCKPYYQSLRG